MNVWPVRRVRVLILAAVMVFSTASCDTLTFSGSPEIRIENGSAVSYDVASYWAGNDLLTYQDLAPGESSPYVTGSGDVYGFTTSTVVIASDTLHIQVIDYVGETPLSGGRYTYVLTAESNPDGRWTLIQDLRKDG